MVYFLIQQRFSETPSLLKSQDLGAEFWFDGFLFVSVFYFCFGGGGLSGWRFFSSFLHCISFS